MRPLVSKPKGKMQMEDYDIHVVGLDLSETHSCDKMVLAKAAQKVVDVDYKLLYRQLRKHEAELENVKGTMGRLQNEA